MNEKCTHSAEQTFHAYFISTVDGDWHEETMPVSKMADCKNLIFCKFFNFTFTNPAFSANVKIIIACKMTKIHSYLSKSLF